MSPVFHPVKAKKLPKGFKLHTTVTGRLTSRHPNASNFKRPWHVRVNAPHVNCRCVGSPEIPRKRKPELVRSVVRHYVFAFLSISHEYKELPIDQHPMAHAADFSDHVMRGITHFVCVMKHIGVLRRNAQGHEWMETLVYPDFIRVELFQSIAKPSRIHAPSVTL